MSFERNRPCAIYNATSDLLRLAIALGAVTFTNVKTFGAKGDGVLLTDGAITSGLAVLDSNSALFTSYDVSKSIIVPGAGVGGADLSTTIVSIQSTTRVTLNTTASTSVISAYVIYGTDDTVAIQATIDSVLSSNKGVVYLPAGIYMISGALQTSNNYNTQLRCGVTSNPDHTTMVSLTLLGAFEQPVFPLELYTQPPHNTGTILQSTLTSTSGIASVLGCPRGNGGLTGLCPICVTAENLTIRTPNNPQLTAFDFEYSMQSVVNNCSAEITREPARSIQPSNSEAIGLRMSKENNSVCCLVNNFYAHGFYYGMSWSEHLKAGFISFQFCYRACKLTSGGHINSVDHLSIHHCGKGLVWSGDNKTIITSATYERGTPSGYDFTPPAWADSTADIDGAGFLAQGSIVYDSTSFQDSLAGARGYLTITNVPYFSVRYIDGALAGAEIVLSQADIAGTTGYQTLGTVSLAGAGDYEIHVNSQIYYTTALGNVYCLTDLYDATGSAEVANSERSALYVDTTSGSPASSQHPFTHVQVIRVSRPTTLRFRAIKLGAGSITSLQFVSTSGFGIGRFFLRPG